MSDTGSEKNVSSDRDDCPICQDTLFDGHLRRAYDVTVLPCSHKIHYRCLFDASPPLRTCPLCRHPIGAVCRDCRETISTVAVFASGEVSWRCRDCTINHQYKIIGELRRKVYSVQKGVHRLQNTVSGCLQAHEEGGVSHENTCENLKDACFGFFGWFDDFSTNGISNDLVMSPA
jgi:Zn-finger protein